jgi:hypothetical protein
MGQQTGVNEMTAKLKTVTMQVTVSCPKWLTAAQARKEVRSLINDEAFWGHCDPTGAAWEICSDNFRAVKITA